MVCESCKSGIVENEDSSGYLLVDNFLKSFVRAVGGRIEVLLRRPVRDCVVGSGDDGARVWRDR